MPDPKRRAFTAPVREPMSDEQYLRCALGMFDVIQWHDGTTEVADLDLRREAILGLADRFGHSPIWFFIVLRYCFEFNEMTPAEAEPVVAAAIKRFDPNHSANPADWLGEHYGGGAGAPGEQWESF